MACHCIGIVRDCAEHAYTRTHSDQVSLAPNAFLATVNCLNQCDNIGEALSPLRRSGGRFCICVRLRSTLLSHTSDTFWRAR